MTLQHYILTFQGSVLKDVKEDLDVVRNQQGYIHKCNLVNDRNAQTRAFLHLLIGRSMTPMRFGQWHECRLLSVDHTQLSMTRMHFGQWHECMLLSVNHTQSMTPMLTAMCNIHSALIPECDLDSAKFSWVWFTLSAFLSLTMSLTAFKLCKHSNKQVKMELAHAQAPFWSPQILPSPPKSPLVPLAC